MKCCWAFIVGMWRIDKWVSIEEEDDEFGKMNEFVKELCCCLLEDYLFKNFVIVGLFHEFFGLCHEGLNVWVC